MWTSNFIVGIEIGFLDFENTLNYKVTYEYISFFKNSNNKEEYWEKR